jgi:hypothetical protein
LIWCAEQMLNQFRLNRAKFQILQQILLDTFRTMRWSRFRRGISFYSCQVASFYVHIAVIFSRVQN